MLKHIHIRDFALAQNLAIEFEPGLNIITGETGTGKSIIVGAISAVLGGRVYTEVVRTGAEKAVVEAIFDISQLPHVKELLKSKGLENNHELFLRREIQVKGSTRAFVNDMPVTITTLAEIGDLLVDIHGQNEHQTLLRKDTHRYFLDAFGQLDSLLRETAEAYRRLKKAEQELKDLERKQKELDEKYELYQFQREEIDKAQLRIGEEEDLIAERNILANAERIFELSSEFNQLVSSNENFNLQELLGQALHILRELAGYSDALNSLYQEFSSAKIVVEEADRTVEEFKSRLEFDPARLEAIEERLEIVSRLKKKYGDSIKEILEYRERIEAELQLKENYDFELVKLNQAYQDARSAFAKSALKLSQARKKVAQELEKAVIQQLNQIGMPKTRFKVHFEWIEDESGIFDHDGQHYYADEQGVDQIEFFISPNPGEDFKPLAKIASGGEISRIMLALKNILADIDRIPLLIFDEIDTGVSGRIALAVGKSIQKLESSHQVICITHLPQIASFGNSHYRVEKFEKDGRTFTQIKPLDEDERIEEIAKLIGGEKLSNDMLKSAQQLLREARLSRS